MLLQFQTTVLPLSYMLRTEESHLSKKTCLHIHGVFPYIYVPFDGELDPNQQMYQLAASLDKALNIALGTANSARQHIYKVVHVKGVPFYGYHEKSHQFLKIYFYNPLIVKKATDLLQNGAVCNKIFQCHEAHLPFILQFFIDYNLLGMSFIQLSSVDIRKEPGSMHSNLECDVRLAKTTHCELEVDGLASHILNRKTVSGE
ncbi:DNA polymerase zeta catalytic subunit-like [Nilaparvata lugens]|uniref:DNA polymerase zeta catalytic subunit-like n=1 Tax=Nilaparvata lugens TaxID=108931 RepID=UPI00193E8EE4|nr:DNA polymerase zeta catalytic subunit-like [Nilaparvata lugens]